MDCDAVFMVLTSGPFPTGTAVDSRVESHLAVCFSCHCLAEALRPAADLTTEAIDPEESRLLPGYWVDSDHGTRGVLTTQRKRPPLVSIRVRPSVAPAQTSRHKANLVRFVIAMAVGAAAALLLYAAGIPLQ